MHPDSVTARWSTEMLLASQAFLKQLVNDRAFALNQRDRLRIARSWRYVESANEFTLGRLRLLDGRWQDSRAHFSRAISLSQVRVSAASIVGWCLSWLHCSMETVFQLAGRSPLRTQK